MFTLNITLGNDAMQDQYDVAQALMQVAESMDLDGKTSGAIFDANGNRVGTFAMEDN